MTTMIVTDPSPHYYDGGPTPSPFALGDRVEIDNPRPDADGDVYAHIGERYGYIAFTCLSPEGGGGHSVASLMAAIVGTLDPAQSARVLSTSLAVSKVLP